jgi:pimeloyl-ACP methyl ester carboxylesterase
MSSVKKPAKKISVKGASKAQTATTSSIKIKPSSSMKTLHALVVAIDKYPIKGHELNGCVNDASAFADYLKAFCQKSGITYSEKRLFDADAARLKIVEGFKHFDAAKDGDTCVYYYSGHGSTMPAPDSFWDEPDHMSQTIVCHDSRTGRPGCRDMADKEIGYLIHSATKGRDVHFLAVTDCCHSGTNTRDIASKEGIKARMAETCPTSPRAIEDYIGFKEWTNYQPPSSKHVHLAAAKNDETAKECKIEGTSRGVFTYSLIETLQQMNGNINYTELMQRVSIKASGRVKEQTPQLNAYGPTNTQDIRLSFLGFTQPQGGNFLVSFNEENGWTVNAGGIQGLPVGEATEFEMENGIKVKTTDVLSNYSKINLELPSTNTIFNAKLTAPIQMASKPIRLALSKDSDAGGAKALKAAFAKAELAAFKLVDNDRDTDYVIRAWDGSFRLTTVDGTAPLFKRVKDLSEDGATEFLNRCSTVAEWRNRLQIANPATSISEEDVAIVFYDANGIALNLPAFDKNGKAADTTPVFRQANKDSAVYCQVSIENKSNRALWFSSVYFGSDFSITNTFLRPKQVGAGQTAWMEFKGKKNIPLWLPLEYLSWGVNETLEYFKIFVSTDKLDTDMHNQDGLPLDAKDVGASRLVRESAPMQDWRTFDRPFRTVSPMAGQTLTANATRQLNDVEITAPTGFTAKVNLSSTGDTKRALDSTALPPIKGNNYLESGAFAEGMGFSTPLDVLEISAVEGEISKAHPLTIKFLNPPKKKKADGTEEDYELLIPLGFDDASGLYLPLGGCNTEGSLLIDTLPSPSPSGERSVGTSFKIFLKKMFVKPLTGEFDYPLLQSVEYTDNPEVFTYGTNKEELIKRVAKAEKIVLFIHGFAGSTSELPKSLRRNLDGNGKNLADNYNLALAFNYESINTPIEKTAEMLEAKLAEIGLKAGHGKQFHIVAHSMGGLVSRWFIERRSGKNVVSQLIMLGTPNAGSAIPALHDSFKTLFTMLVNGVPLLNAWSTPISWLGKAVETAMVTVKQQIPTSDFFKQLNESPDAGVPYRIVVGNTQLLLTPKKDVEGTFSKIYQHFKSRKMYAVSDTFFGEANDMVVPDASIGSAGLQKNVKIEVIPAHHFSYFVPEADGLKTLATFIG